MCHTNYTSCLSQLLNKYTNSQTTRKRKKKQNMKDQGFEAINQQIDRRKEKILYKLINSNSKMFKKTKEKKKTK